MTSRTVSDSKAYCPNNFCKYTYCLNHIEQFTKCFDFRQDDKPSLRVVI